MHWTDVNWSLIVQVAMLLTLLSISSRLAEVNTNLKELKDLMAPVSHEARDKASDRAGRAFSL
jgi:hypothetical protein